MQALPPSLLQRFANVDHDDREALVALDGDEIIAVVRWDRDADRPDEAEVAALAQSFNMDVTTDFGQLEQMIQGKIDKNRGKARVAADLSQEGLASIQAEEKMEKVMAEEALTNFEVELGLKSPETTPVTSATKDLGPASVNKDKSAETN